VHSDLARALDPHLNEIIQLLQGMAKLAASLPER
jgi:hypothetical protein